MMDGAFSSRLFAARRPPLSCHAHRRCESTLFFMTLPKSAFLPTSYLPRNAWKHFTTQVFNNCSDSSASYVSIITVQTSADRPFACSESVASSCFHRDSLSNSINHVLRKTIESVAPSRPQRTITCEFLFFPHVNFATSVARRINLNAESQTSGLKKLPSLRSFLI